MPIRNANSGPFVIASDFAAPPAQPALLGTSNGRTFEYRPIDVAGGVASVNALESAVAPLQRSFGPFESIAAFRAATPPSVLTSFVIDGVGQYTYDPAYGANVADNGATVLKPTSVDLAAAGRAKLTSIASLATDNAATAVTRITPPPHAVVTGGTLALNGDELNKLISELTEVIGLKMIDMFFGDALKNPYTLDTTWPSSAGRIFPLTKVGAAAAFSICVDPDTGRKGIVDYVGSQGRSMQCSTTEVVKACLVVFRSYGANSVGPASIFACGAGHVPMTQQEGTKLLRNEAGYGSPVHYTDGVQTRELVDFQVLYAEETSNTAGGFYCAGWGANYSMFGELYAIIPLNDVLTASELASATATLHRFYGIRKNDLVLFEGHSIAYGHVDDAGSGSAGYFPWHKMTVPRLCGFVNHAQSGSTLTQIQDRLATNLGAHNLNAYRKVIYFLDGDTNSYRSSGWTGPQVVAANFAIADAARAAGCKVILSSSMRYDAIAVPAGNAAKAAGWPEHADAYCDLFAQNIELNANLHPTKNGYMKYARTVREVILSLLA